MSNSHLTERPLSAVDRFDGPSTSPGRCMWCGAAVRRSRNYCSRACSRKFNNRLAVIGKRVTYRLLVWRIFRGRKGTPAEGLLSEVTRILDAALKEDTDRRSVGASACGPKDHKMENHHGSHG